MRSYGVLATNRRRTFLPTAVLCRKLVRAVTLAVASRYPTTKAPYGRLSSTEEYAEGTSHSTVLSRLLVHAVTLVDASGNTTGKARYGGIGRRNPLLRMTQVTVLWEVTGAG